MTVYFYILEGKQGMAQKKWALRPGERMLEEAYQIQRKNRLDKDYEKVVADYLSKVDRRPIVLNDSKEVVYFITYKEPFVFDTVDVAVYDGYDYDFLPKDLALKVTKAYLYYVDVMGEAYGYIDFGGDEE
jgi:CRP-like cAMP-binding protein